MALIITTGEESLDEAVQHDEKITTAHLANLELGDARLPAAPRDRNDSEAVAANDGLEWQFDGEIEMMREDRLESSDNLPAIALEGICGVVIAQPEHRADEYVGEPVDNQLVLGVADHLTT